MAQDNIFQPIGEVAQQTDAQSEIVGGDALRQVQETDSLCMECHQQVRHIWLAMLVILLADHQCTACFYV